MKAAEFATFLTTYALQLSELQADEYANDLSVFATLFQRQATSATVNAALKPLAKIDPKAVQQGGLIDRVISALRLANMTMKEFGKPALVKDIQFTLVAFEPFKYVDFAELLRRLDALRSAQQANGQKPPIREELVASYNDRLLAALNDEIKFPAIFAELKTAKKLTADELKRLGKLFRGETVKSGPAALKAIWARHHSLIDSNERTRASAGRSAA